MAFVLGYLPLTEREATKGPKIRQIFRISEMVQKFILFFRTNVHIFERGPVLDPHFVRFRETGLWRYPTEIHDSMGCSEERTDFYTVNPYGYMDAAKNNP